MSRLFNYLASSILLVSTIASSHFDDYYLCADETATEEYSLEEILFNEADLEELDIPLEAEADDHPSIVLICFVTMLFTVSLNLLLCLLPLLFFIFLSIVEQAILSSKPDFCRFSGGAMIDVWDPSAPKTLPEHTRRVNFICRRRIAIVSGDVD
ncbi:MAG: hypothetical protein GY847_22875 [Proteobacteria bacterium]|nr:hypothetical protein [Pseudomonadota bacterium]